MKAHAEKAFDVAVRLAQAAQPFAAAYPSLHHSAACAFVATFWGVRLVIAFFLFDATPFLKTFPLKLGYHGLTIVFVYFTVVYGLAALAMPSRN